MQNAAGRSLIVEVQRCDHGRVRPGSVRYHRTVRTLCRKRAGDAHAAAGTFCGQYRAMHAEKMNKK
jgi:hypothetical protein